MTKRVILFDEKTFHTELEKLLQKQVKKHAALLFTEQEWTMESDCKQEIMNAVDNFVRRYLYRASLFAMHRTNATNVNGLKKRKVVMKEDDLELAWKTLTE